MPRKELVEKIARLKSERGAVILAHNYQLPEIQDIADKLGDSLDLSRHAASVDAATIVFCGVHFMAETAAILAPGKTVLLPDPAAGCPMADMMTAEDLRTLKAKHPGAAVVTYVNSTAEVKAETDICCTSANAVAVVRSIPPERKIVFGPDKYLGGWVSRQTGRKMIVWQGHCPTHQKIYAEQIEELRRIFLDAVVMVHPETNPAVADLADVVLGTGGMIKYVRESAATTFIVGTEVGMVHRLKKEFPDRQFVAASKHALCPNMKKITLEKVAAALERMEPAITVAPEIAERARTAIRRMIEIG